MKNAVSHLMAGKIPNWGFSGAGQQYFLAICIQHQSVIHRGFSTDQAQSLPLKDNYSAFINIYSKQS